MSVDVGACVDASSIASLLRDVLKSLDERAAKYHYRLIGSQEDSLGYLLGIEELHFQCILSICGLYNVENGRYNVRDYRVFDPCQIIFVSMCLQQNDKSAKKQRVYFLEVGKRPNPGVTGPMKQYYLNKTSPNKSEHHHMLDIAPPDIRLTREEKKTIEEIKAKSSSMLGTLSRKVKLSRSARPKETSVPYTRLNEQRERKQLGETSLNRCFESITKFVSLPNGSIDLDRSSLMVELIEHIAHRLKVAEEAKPAQVTPTSNRTQYLEAIRSTAIAGDANVTGVAAVTPPQAITIDGTIPDIEQAISIDSIKKDEKQLQHVLKELVTYMSREEGKTSYV